MEEYASKSSKKIRGGLVYLLKKLVSGEKLDDCLAKVAALIDVRNRSMGFRNFEEYWPEIDSLWERLSLLRLGEPLLIARFSVRDEFPSEQSIDEGVRQSLNNSRQYAERTYLNNHASAEELAQVRLECE
jgi:hypothetical protein